MRSENETHVLDECEWRTILRPIYVEPKLNFGRHC